MSTTDKICGDDKTTVFNDPIHGHIELPDICVKIINTPEFLRLRNIKQLGATYEVFPGAAHNRFEHCIGVAFLAGKFATHLQRQIDKELENESNGFGVSHGEDKFTKEMRITKRDITCLQVAGLCHDLGHGPMSHIFETRFAKLFDHDWSHEDVSCKLFDQLIKKNKIEFEAEGDEEFIKALIHKPKNENHIPEEVKKLEAKMCEKTKRKADKNFLYQIVSNDDNGIDVDKFDYFARDCYQLGFKNNFDHNRLITFSRVIKVEGKWHICYRDKQVEDIYHMFLSRVILHRRACQHKTVQVLERMYMEALNKANDSYKFVLRNGKPFKISESLTDMEAYVKLTDNVFIDIRNSPVPGLKDAQEILDRIDKRQLYKLAAEAIPKIQHKKKSVSTQTDADETVDNDDQDTGKHIFQLTGETEKDEKTIIEGVVGYSNGSLKTKDLFVDISDFHFGKKEQNPVDSVYFYNKTLKNGSYKAFHVNREDVSSLLPAVYSEKHIRLYVREANNLDKARESFTQWCKKNDMNGKWKNQ